MSEQKKVREMLFNLGIREQCSLGQKCKKSSVQGKISESRVLRSNISHLGRKYRYLGVEVKNASFCEFLTKINPSLGAMTHKCSPFAVIRYLPSPNFGQCLGKKTQGSFRGFKKWVQILLKKSAVWLKKFFNPHAIILQIWVS